MAQTRFVPLSPSATSSKIVLPTEKKEDPYDLQQLLDPFMGFGQYDLQGGSQPALSEVVPGVRGAGVVPPRAPMQIAPRMSVPTGDTSQADSALSMLDMMGNYQRAIDAARQQYEKGKPDFSSLKLPSYNFNEQAPALGNQNFQQSMPHALDIALAMGGLGSLLGNPNFGVGAGVNFLKGSAAGANAEDQRAFQAAQQGYLARMNAADKAYGQDVDLYNAQANNLSRQDATNQRVLDTNIDNATRTLGIQRQMQADQERVAIQDKQNKLRGLVQMYLSGRLGAEAQDELTKGLNDVYGTELYGNIMGGLRPEDQAKVEIARMGNASREKVAGMNASAAMERLEKTIQATKEHDAIVSRDKIAVANIAAATRKVVAGMSGQANTPQGKYFYQTAQLAQRRLDSISRNLERDRSALSSARAAIDKLKTNKNLFDANNPGALSPLGQQAVADAQKRYDEALDRYNQTHGEYMQQAAELDAAYAQFKATQVPPPTAPAAAAPSSAPVPVGPTPAISGGLGELDMRNPLLSSSQSFFSDPKVNRSVPLPSKVVPVPGNTNPGKKLSPSVGKSAPAPAPSKPAPTQKKAAAPVPAKQTSAIIKQYTMPNGRIDIAKARAEGKAEALKAALRAALIKN